MATTRQALRAALLEIAHGDHFSLTTSEAGLADGTTVVDTDLEGFSDDPSFFENWWCLITSGNASGEAKQITDYNGSNLLTVVPAFTAQIADSVTFELMPWRPDMIHASINTAGRRLSPYIYLPIVDETLVADQLGSNLDFEGDFATGVPDGWSEDDSGTQTTAQETTRVHQGGSSVSLAVSSGSADRSIYQDLTINIADLVGKTLTFGGLMWSTTADSGWLQIDFGDGGTTNSTKHAGDEDWQVEEVKATVPSDASRIRIRCYALASGTPTVYFDSLFCYAYPITRYALPTSFIGSPDTIEIANSRLDPNRNYELVTNWTIEKDGETEYIRFGFHPPSGQRMRLKGRGALTLPTSDSASMEVEDHRIDLIIELAASELFRRLAAGAGGDDADEHWTRADRHFQMVQQLLSLPGMKMLQGTNLRYPRK